MPLRGGRGICRFPRIYSTFGFYIGFGGNPGFWSRGLGLYSINGGIPSGINESTFSLIIVNIIHYSQTKAQSLFPQPLWNQSGERRCGVCRRQSRA